MRRFSDHEQRRWQAAVSFGSFGQMHVVFSRMDGDELRTARLASGTQFEAENELAELEDEPLLELLAKAEPFR